MIYIKYTFSIVLSIQIIASSWVWAGHCLAPVSPFCRDNRMPVALECIRKARTAKNPLVRSIFHQVSRSLAPDLADKQDGGVLQSVSTKVIKSIEWVAAWPEAKADQVSADIAEYWLTGGTVAPNFIMLLWVSILCCVWPGGVVGVLVGIVVMPLSIWFLGRDFLEQLFCDGYSEDVEVLKRIKDIGNGYLVFSPFLLVIQGVVPLGVVVLLAVLINLCANSYLFWSLEAVMFGLKQPGGPLLNYAINRALLFLTQDEMVKSRRAVEFLKKMLSTDCALSLEVIASTVNTLIDNEQNPDISGNESYHVLCDIWKGKRDFDQDLLDHTARRLLAQLQEEHREQGAGLILSELFSSRQAMDRSRFVVPLVSLLSHANSETRCFAQVALDAIWQSKAGYSLSSTEIDTIVSVLLEDTLSSDTPSKENHGVLCQIWSQKLAFRQDLIDCTASRLMKGLEEESREALSADVLHALFTSPLSMDRNKFMKLLLALLSHARSQTREAAVSALNGIWRSQAGEVDYQWAYENIFPLLSSPDAQVQHSAIAVIEGLRDSLAEEDEYVVWLNEILTEVGRLSLTLFEQGNSIAPLVFDLVFLGQQFWCREAIEPGAQELLAIIKSDAYVLEDRNLAVWVLGRLMGILEKEMPKVFLNIFGELHYMVMQEDLKADHMKNVGPLVARYLHSGYDISSYQGFMSLIAMLARLTGQDIVCQKVMYHLGRVFHREVYLGSILESLGSKTEDHLGSVPLPHTHIPQQWIEEAFANLMYYLNVVDDEKPTNGQVFFYAQLLYYLHGRFTPDMILGMLEGFNQRSSAYRSLVPQLVEYLSLKQPDIFTEKVIEQLFVLMESRAEWKYSLYYLGEKIGDSQKRAALASRFFYRQQSINLEGVDKVLVTHWVADGFGDQLVRNIFLQALQDLNPDLEVTVHTKDSKEFLYSNFRIIQTKGQVRKLNLDEFDLVITHIPTGTDNFSPFSIQRIGPEAFVLRDRLVKMQEAGASSTDGPILIRLGYENSMVINRVTVTNGQVHELADLYSKDAVSALSCYSIPYRLCAELDIPCQFAEHPYKESFMTPQDYPKAIRWMEKNLAPNRPTVAIAGFGGQSSTKGFGHHEDHIFALEIESIVKQGCNVLLVTKASTEEGIPRAERICARLSSQYRKYVSIMPPPYSDPIMQAALLARCDCLVTFEGLFGHWLNFLRIPGLVLERVGHSGEIGVWVTPSLSSSQLALVYDFLEPGSLGTVVQHLLEQHSKRTGNLSETLPNKSMAICQGIASDIVGQLPEEDRQDKDKLMSLICGILLTAQEPAIAIVRDDMVANRFDECTFLALAKIMQNMRKRHNIKTRSAEAVVIALYQVLKTQPATPKGRRDNRKVLPCDVGNRQLALAA